MKVLVFLSLVAASAAAPQYVWDLLKPALNAAEVQAILSRADPGQYPTYSEIPQTNFDCTRKKQPGFYADVDAQCQVFHRCDINGNMTSYLCVNTTMFNQITLVCDYFFNVDCNKAIQFENFANERLYKEGAELFDTPPADYIPISAGKSPVGPVVPIKPRPPVKGQTTKKPAATTTTAAPVEETTAAAEETTAAAEETTAAPAEETTAAPAEETTAAPAEETPAPAEETTAAAEETTAAAAGEGAEASSKSEDSGANASAGGTAEVSGESQSSE